MDGGYNFQDLCHVCGKSQQRGMMKQVHKQDRNKNRKKLVEKDWQHCY